MIHRFLRCFSLILLALATVDSRADSAYTAEGEVDVHYKKQLPIYLQHELGDVSIQGWNQDRIRVKFKKAVNADSEISAQEIFKKFDLISLETPTSIELRVGTPQGTDLLTKLRNRQQKRGIHVDLEIKAPSSLALTVVLGQDKKLKLSQWKGKLNVTGHSNSLEFSKLRLAQSMNVNCPNCRLVASDSEFSGSILVGDQKIEMSKTKAGRLPLLIFTQKGEVALEGTEGDIQVRSLRGDIHSRNHLGNLQVRSDHGNIRIEEVDGDLDVQTQNSGIFVDVKRIPRQFELKNNDGPIQVQLPHDFAGEMFLQSLRGEVNSDFIVQKNKKKAEMLYGPELKGRLIGTVGGGGRINVSVSSENGKIYVKQKEVLR